MSSRTWRLNRSSRGCRDRTSSVRATCSPSAAGSTSPSFSNAEAEVGVVLVGVADHEPGRQDDRHRLVERQLQRRQEALGGEAPAPALRPDGDVDLALDRVEVAVDGPLRHVDPAGDLLDRHAVRVGLEERHDAGQPRQAVALAGPRLVVHLAPSSARRRVDPQLAPRRRGRHAHTDRALERALADRRRLRR